MKHRITALVTVFLCLVAGMVNAQNFPAPLSPYVNDYAQIIDAETSAQIEQVLRETREADGREITVVTTQSLADIGTSGSVQAAATALFNAWGVGDATANNGVLMLIALDEREAFIALGSGYDAKYDAAMDNVFDQYMRDNFRAERYSEGIEAATYAIIDRTSESFDFTGGKTSWQRFTAWLGDAIPFIIFGLVAVFVFFKRQISNVMYKMKRCPNCGRRMLSRDIQMNDIEHDKKNRRQTTYETCGNCEWRDERSRVLPIRSGSSGGGSFGGGSSSGGGGGGKW